MTEVNTHTGELIALLLYCVFIAAAVTWFEARPPRLPRWLRRGSRR